MSSNDLPEYPKDHQVGMEVPVGGSNCDKCKHLVGPQRCDDDEFIEWNDGDRIPVKTDRYCCDFFETSKAKAAKNEALAVLMASPSATNES